MNSLQSAEYAYRLKTDTWFAEYAYRLKTDTWFTEYAYRLDL
jgi:hypothetical protein